MENQVMLFMNVQKNMDDMQHTISVTNPQLK
jgi:hypothetical protein